jgi:hypothetical protein
MPPRGPAASCTLNHLGHGGVWPASVSTRTQAAVAFFARPHISPDDATQFDSGVSSGAHLRAKLQFEARSSGRHRCRHVELPTG